jgi:sensor histidine kinase YesM
MFKTFLKSNLKVIPVILLGGIGMSYFIWKECCENVNAFYWIAAFTSTLWLALWLGNAFLSDWLSLFYNWKTQPLQRFAVGVVGMVVYTLGIVYIIIKIYGLAGFNLGDDLEPTYVSTVVITMIITMFMTGRAFLMNWKQTEIDAEKARRESAVARYDSLKNQVNPHFLFNSLNALTNLVYEDKDKAVNFIKQLSQVYRYVLESADKELVSIEDELDFLKSYIFLQEIRFGQKLKIDLLITTNKGLIAPLALQMLIENAIKHNVISENSPLLVEVYEDEKYWTVKNKVNIKTNLEESIGKGLKNIQERYTYLSDLPVAIKNDNGYFVVSIPILQS